MRKNSIIKIIIIFIGIIIDIIIIIKIIIIIIGSQDWDFEQRIWPSRCCHVSS